MGLMEDTRLGLNLRDMMSMPLQRWQPKGSKEKGKAEEKEGEKRKG